MRALLYLPDGAARPLAAAAVAGRPLVVRAMVAAFRAGASLIAVPSTLRDAATECALRRMPELAASVRWLTPGAPAPAEAPSAWLLLPASSLIHVSTLAELLAAPAPRGVVLAASAGGPAPVALVPAPFIAELWAELWTDLVAGRPVGVRLARRLADGGALVREATGPHVTVHEASDLTRAEAALEGTLGTAVDTGVDRHLHRRCSRRISRLLARTPVAPNHLSLVNLAIGLVTIWCFWHATIASALVGVLTYALACIVDCADGEIARLTFQESRTGATLDWAIDTTIQAGIVLGLGVSSGGPVMAVVGLLAAIGVTLSAVFTRYLPRRIAVGPSASGLLTHIASPDVFYVLLLSFVALRWLAPSLVFVVAALVAVGSQVYWVSFLARAWRPRT